MTRAEASALVTTKLIIHMQSLKAEVMLGDELNLQTAAAFRIHTRAILAQLANQRRQAEAGFPKSLSRLDRRRAVRVGR